jgi:hypothetical protein
VNPDETKFTEKSAALKSVLGLKMFLYSIHDGNGREKTHEPEDVHAPERRRQGHAHPVPPSPHPRRICFPTMHRRNVDAVADLRDHHRYGGRREQHVCGTNLAAIIIGAVTTAGGVVIATVLWVDISTIWTCIAVLGKSKGCRLSKAGVLNARLLRTAG